MTDAETFAEIDAAIGNTLVAFTTRSDAEHYLAHRARHGTRGYIAMVEDTRGQSGLTVIWRDPVPLAEVTSRQAQARWLLERIIAGQFPMPPRGEVGTLWQGGLPKHLAQGH